MCRAGGPTETCRNLAESLCPTIRSWMTACGGCFVCHSSCPKLHRHVLTPATLQWQQGGGKNSNRGRAEAARFSLEPCCPCRSHSQSSVSSYGPLGISSSSDSRRSALFLLRSITLLALQCFQCCWLPLQTVHLRLINNIHVNDGDSTLSEAGGIASTFSINAIPGRLDNPMFHFNFGQTSSCANLGGALIEMSVYF